VDVSRRIAFREDAEAIQCGIKIQPRTNAERLSRALPRPMTTSSIAFPPSAAHPEGPPSATKYQNGCILIDHCNKLSTYPRIT
jgi:hypothetical protein